MIAIPYFETATSDMSGRQLLWHCLLVWMYLHQKISNNDDEFSQKRVVYRIRDGDNPDIQCNGMVHRFPRSTSAANART